MGEYMGTKLYYYHKSYNRYVDIVGIVGIGGVGVGVSV